MYCTFNGHIEREVNENSEISPISAILNHPLIQDLHQVDQNNFNFGLNQNLQLTLDEIDTIFQSLENNVTGDNTNLSTENEQATITIHQPEIIQIPPNNFVNSYPHLNSSLNSTSTIEGPIDLEYPTKNPSSSNNSVFNSYPDILNEVSSIKTIEGSIDLEYPSNSELSCSNSTPCNSSGFHSSGLENPQSQSNLDQNPDINTLIENASTKIFFEEYQTTKHLENNVFYQLIVELALRLVYFKSYVFRFHKKIITLYSQDSIFKEQSEIVKSFVILIDKLLELNEIQKSKPVILEEKKKYEKLQKKVQNFQSRIKKAKRRIDLGIYNPANISGVERSLLKSKQLLSVAQEQLKTERENSIYFQIHNFISKVSRNLTQRDYKFTNTMITIYEPFKNIVDFYNSNLKPHLHQYLIRLDLSFITSNQKLIKYSNYENSPNYLAYLIVDLIHSICNSVLRKKNFILSEDIEFQQQLVDLIILYFLSLNKLEVTSKLMKNEIVFDTFRSEIYSIISKKEIGNFFNEIIQETLSIDNKLRRYLSSSIGFSTLTDAKAIKIKGLVKRFLTNLYEIGEISIKKALEIN